MQEEIKAMMISMGAGELANRESFMQAVFNVANAPDYLYDSFCSEFTKDCRESFKKRTKGAYNGTSGDAYMGWADSTLRTIFEERPAFMNKLCKFCKRNMTPCGGSGIVVGNILSQYQVGSSLCMFYRQSTHLSLAKSKLLISSSSQQDCTPLKASSPSFEGDCVLGNACCLRWGLSKNERRLQEEDGEKSNKKPSSSAVKSNNNSSSQQQYNNNNNTTSTTKSNDNGCESRHCRFCSPEVVVNNEGVEELHYATFNPTSLAIPLSADVSTMVSKHVQNIRRWVREPLLAEIEDDSAPINEGRGFLIICNENTEEEDSILKKEKKSRRDAEVCPVPFCQCHKSSESEDDENSPENFEKRYGFKKDGKRLYIGGRVVYPILSRFAPPPAPISMEVAWVIAKAALQELILPMGQKKPAFFQRSVLDIVAKEKAETPTAFQQLTALSKHRASVKMVCASNATKIIRMSFRITRPLLSPFLSWGLPRVVVVLPPEIEQEDDQEESKNTAVASSTNNTSGSVPELPKKNNEVAKESLQEDHQPKENTAAVVAPIVEVKKKKKKQQQQQKQADIDNNNTGPTSYRRKPGVVGDGSSISYVATAPDSIRVLAPVTTSPTSSSVDELSNRNPPVEEEEKITKSGTSEIKIPETKAAAANKPPVPETKAASDVASKIAAEKTPAPAATNKPSVPETKVAAVASKVAKKQTEATPSPTPTQNVAVGDVHTSPTLISLQQLVPHKTTDEVLKVETEEARIDEDEMPEEIPLTEDRRIIVDDEEEIIIEEEEELLSEGDEESMDDSMTTVPTDPSVVEEEEIEEADDSTSIQNNNVIEKVTDIPAYVPPPPPPPPPPPQQKQNVLPTTGKAAKKNKNGKLVVTTTTKANDDVITTPSAGFTPSPKSTSKQQQNQQKKPEVVPSGTTTIKPTSSTAFIIPAPRSKVMAGATTTTVSAKPIPQTPEKKQLPVTLAVPKSMAAVGAATQATSNGAKSSSSYPTPLSFKDTFVKAIQGGGTTTSSTATPPTYTSNTNTIPATTRTAASVVAGNMATPAHNHHLLPSLSTSTTTTQKKASVWGALPSSSSATSDSTQTSTIGHIVKPANVNVSLAPPPQQQQQHAMTTPGGVVKGVEATPPYTAPGVAQSVGGVKHQEQQPPRQVMENEAPVRTAPPPIVNGSLAPASDWTSARQRRRERRRVLQDTTTTSTPVSSETVIERDGNPLPGGGGGGGEDYNPNRYKEEFVGFGGCQPSGNDQQQFNPFDSIPASTPAPPYNNAWTVTSTTTSSSSAPVQPPAYREPPFEYNNKTNPHHHYQQQTASTMTTAAPSYYADAFKNRSYADDDEESIDFEIPIDIDDLVD